MQVMITSSQKERTPRSGVYKKVVNGEYIVVKKTTLKEDGIAMFCMNEAMLLSICNHPCVVKYLNSYSDGEGTYYIEMEFLGGGTLGSVRLNGKYEKLWRWVYQVCHALCHIHRKGIIHRDIKLSNVVLDQRGNAKLIDFGVATFKWKLVQEGFKMAGTPCYTAPEMIRKLKYDEKVDIYALGVCLYQLAYGRTPFRGEKVEEYWRNTLTEEVAWEGECPGELVRLMKSMLEKDPAKRITALEIVTDQLVKNHFLQLASLK